MYEKCFNSDIHFLSEKEKNKTGESENATNVRFYGPARTCMELLKIGYTRNGFYMVKGNDTSNSGNVEVVDCLFKNPNGAKESIEKLTNNRRKIRIKSNNLLELL